MATWWGEAYDSRPFHIDQDKWQTNYTLKYKCGGSDNDLVIRQLCEARLPARWRDLYLQSFDVDPMGGDAWDVIAHYGLVDRTSNVYNLDTSGGNAHITQSLGTSGRYGTAPDLNGAIGFDGERVEGTDVNMRKFAWNEQYRLEKVRFTQSYKLVLFNLTYTVNSSTFRGFAAGQVMFNGATASQQGSHDVEITYYFEASPNLGSHMVGAIAVASKLGWEYEWVRYQKSEADNRLATAPDGVYVERVYAYGNLALLGIGV
jgi:hypothetical protein